MNSVEGSDYELCARQTDCMSKVVHTTSNHAIRELWLKGAAEPLRELVTTKAHLLSGHR